MPQVSVVTPTYCEAENIPILFERLKDALSDTDWELVVVDDDSPDGTAEVARAIAQRDPRLRVIQRLHRRGLAGAVIEGMLSSSAPIVAVIDADLQHDETILPAMIAQLDQQSDLELVVASRYIQGGSVGALRVRRQFISKFATRLSRLVSRTEVGDPMSGFFAIRRQAFMSVAHSLSDQGFKILLDIMASSTRPLAAGEVAYEFRNRVHGESKLDSAVAWQYLELLLDKSVGKYVPVRMIKFIAVGSTGVIVAMGTLFALYKLLGVSFVASQTFATFLAMTSNYFLNNIFTFKDRRQSGWRVLTGLLSFYAVCSIGALANVGAASYMFSQHWGWGVAGICGILVGTVWNYAVSSQVTWGRGK